MFSHNYRGVRLEIRKVQEMGGGTLLVSIPKAWGYRHKISKGSFITIEESKDGRLILDPHPKEEEAPQVAVIGYPFESIEYVEWGLIGAYLLGYDHIRIEANKIDSAERVRIKDTIQNLIGLEILEETTDAVKAQCLIDPSLVNPLSLIQRKKVITISMLKDVMTSLLGSDRDLVRTVIRRDDEVDRIYFLLVRLLRSAVQNPRTAEKFDITTLDCLDYRLVAALMESIADHITSIAQELLNLLDLELDKEFLESLSQAFEILEEMLMLSIDGFLAQEIKAIQEVRDKHSFLTRLLETIKNGFDKLATPQSPSWSVLFSYMRYIGRDCVDIVDLIPPNQILTVHRGKASRNNGCY